MTLLTADIKLLWGDNVQLSQKSSHFGIRVTQDQVVESQYPLGWVDRLLQRKCH